MPQIIVLGAAAGGGLPRLHFNCANCRLAWQGFDRVNPRTQWSLAVSVDSTHLLLLNASPDIRLQIATTSELQPRRAARDTPIVAVLLTNSDVDHLAGLLTLREGQAIGINITLFAVPGMSVLYLEDESAGDNSGGSA